MFGDGPAYGLCIHPVMFIGILLGIGAITQVGGVHGDLLVFTLIGIACMDIVLINAACILTIWLLAALFITDTE